MNAINTPSRRGLLGTAAAAVVFIPRGQLFLGALLVTVFVLFDMIDGAMARARGFSTPFGAVLDSVCDRIADGVLFAAIGSRLPRELAISAVFALIGGGIALLVGLDTTATVLAGLVQCEAVRFLSRVELVCLPRRRPLAFATCMPSRVRRRMRSDSNSATIART